MNTLITIDKETKRITRFDEHAYSADGDIWFPGLTYILNHYPKGFGYVQWLKQVGMNADKILDEASDRGSNIHDACEKIANGDKVIAETYEWDEWQQICRYADFLKQVAPQYEQVEVSLCSPKLGYGGTLDIVAWIDEELWLIDIKTGNNIWRPAYLQLAGYKRLWDEAHENKINRAGILWLNAKTRGEREGKIQGQGWQLKEAEDLESDWRALQHLYAIWKDYEPNWKPRHLTLPSEIS